MDANIKKKKQYDEDELFMRHLHINQPPPELPARYIKNETGLKRDGHPKKLTHFVKGWMSHTDSGNKYDESAVIEEQDAKNLAKSKKHRIKRLPKVLEKHGGRKNDGFRDDVNNEYPLNLNYEESKIDTAKTFLTGNIENNAPVFPKNDVEETFDVSINSILDNKNFGDNEEFQLQLSNAFFEPSQFSSHFHLKKHDLDHVLKKFSAIAAKKDEVYKAEQKLLEELGLWQKSFQVIENSSQNLMQEIKTLFMREQFLEKEFSSRLRILVKQLEYVSKREKAYLEKKKFVKDELKCLQTVQDKFGRNTQEFNYQQEKTLVAERALNQTKQNFQNSINHNMRIAINELFVGYYDTLNISKMASQDFLIKSIGKLKNDSNDFQQILQEFTKFRAHNFLSMLSPTTEEENHGVKNLTSALNPDEDTLMRNIFMELRQDHSPARRQNEDVLRKNTLMSPLQESFSDILTENLNPITSNKYLVEKSIKPNNNQENVGPEAPKNKNFSQIPKLQTQIKDDNTSINKLPTEIKIVDQDEKNKIENTNKQNAVNNDQDDSDGLNGYVLNFGEFSKQFDEAQEHLEENRWINN